MVDHKVIGDIPINFFDQNLILYALHNKLGEVRLYREQISPTGMGPPLQEFPLWKTLLKKGWG